MPRRRYTNAEKAAAVGRAAATTTQRASEEMGIPRTTLRQWIDEPQYAELRQKTRDDFAGALWVGMQVGVDQVTRGLMDPDAALRDKATALGILYDKHALLTGAATSRTESRDLTGSLSDVDVIAALRAADEIAVGPRAAVETADEAAG